MMRKRGHEKREDSEPFIYMSGEAIKSLRSELSNLLGDKLAAGVLFRFGFRCGEALVERTMSKANIESGMGESLPGIWKQTGLGKIAKIEEISEEEVEIEQEGSTEAKIIGSAAEPSCDLTRGYLAGIATMLTKKKFYCVETDCISEGKDRCSFQLVVFPHKVYVPKK
jgi:predicted hydrocarbon binding protein